MGNPISCMHLQPEAPEGRGGPSTIKLIKSDGIVKIYDRPILVSELMVEFPKHRVCRSDSFYIGQKIPALSEDDKLQLGHKYFLLPKHFFQSVLSFVTVASFASPQSHAVSSSLEMSRNSKTAFLKKAASCQPFDIQKTPSGCLRIRVSEEFIAQLIMEEGKIKDEEGGAESSSGKPKSRVCTTPQLQKDYTQLVGSRQWKPKLETIKEKEKEKEKRKLSSFGMKRRKKATLQKSQRSEPQPHSTSVKPPSKAKIKRSRKWYLFANLSFSFSLFNSNLRVVSQPDVTCTSGYI